MTRRLSKASRISSRATGRRCLPIFFAFRVDGRHRPADDRDRVCRRLPLVAAKAVRRAWYPRPLTYAWPLGFMAIVAGWWVTGDGPPALPRLWGFADGRRGFARIVRRGTDALILFVLIYSSVFSMGILYINRLIEKGPQGAAISPDADPMSVGSRPLPRRKRRPAARSARRSSSMDTLAYRLPLIWAAILAIAVTLYVILDGFGLGLGILFHVERREAARRDDETIAPFWDGNQTWLVLGGGGLLVAFPRAYGIIMSGLYIPIIVMLLALVFRGVAFEFRWVAKPKHRVLGPGLRVGRARRDVLARRRARRSAARHRRTGRTLRGRHVRLADAVRAAFAAWGLSRATHCSARRG